MFTLVHVFGSAQTGPPQTQVLHELTQETIISFCSGIKSKQITPIKGKIISNESILINYIEIIV